MKSSFQSKFIFTLIFLFLFSFTTELKALPHQHPKGMESCFICDSKKRDKNRLWCKEHSCYEDRCWLCHPELEDKKRLYCKEHKLYEDECFFCNPSLLKKEEKPSFSKIPDFLNLEISPKKEHGNHDNHDHSHDSHEGHDHSKHKEGVHKEEHNHKKQDKKSHVDKNHGSHEGHDHSGHNHGDSGHSRTATGELFCNEHQVLEMECGICQPQLAEQLEPGQGLKIRLASKESAKKSGIQSFKPDYSELKNKLTGFSRVSYNKNKLAEITSIVNGIIKNVYCEEGEKVKKGDILFELNSNKIAEAKSNYLSSLVNFQIKNSFYQRERKLKQKRVSAARELQEAYAAFKIAELNRNNTKQSLLNLGFSNNEIQKISKTKDSSSSFFVRAPFDGTIIKRRAVQGNYVEPGQVIFSIADTSFMWLEISLPVEYAPLISKGLNVKATFKNFPEVIKGKVSFISSSIDRKNQMVRLRAEVDNHEKYLKEGLFGEAEILIEKKVFQHSVSLDSVLEFDGKDFVFTELEKDLFSFTRVLVSKKTLKKVFIKEGLSSNRPVVTRGVFTLYTEFLKSRLGAGCADH